ncbi:MAG: 4Fe-4S binding protein [bacterium]
MAKRKIIKIDEAKCNGCGLCLPNCPEGALRVIDGKVRLISDLFCDGLGACIGHCPEGAITVEEREAEPYNEAVVMENIIKAGSNTIKAHLIHLQEHGETEFYNEAVKVLKKHNIEVPNLKNEKFNVPCSCPGAAVQELKKDESEEPQTGKRQSQLRQWPVQLHLVPPTAPYFKRADVVLAADCVAYALADFHKDYLKGKSLAIACPKLDSDQEIYVDKITALIDEAKINTLTVMIMQVPCCGGLMQMAKAGAVAAKRKIPLKAIVVGLQGEILKEEWM